jgi:hypothetical protein
MQSKGIHGPRRLDEDLSLLGTVRWTNASGMGIQFGLLGAQETHETTEIQREHGTFTGVC